MSRVVVITGASEGIGAALAKRLGAAGDSVVLAARRTDKLQAVADACGERTLTVAMDATKLRDIQRLRDTALERFGKIDVWVNNVGRGVGIPVLDLTEEQLDEILAVNLKSAWYGIKTIIPYFQSRGEGHLINISSVLGRVPISSYRSIYSASKAALNSLTANLRMDLRAEYPNIRVSLILPGVVATDFHANALSGTPGSPERSPMAQSADDVAAVIEDVINHPVPERYTNPASADFVRSYIQDIAAFEDNLLAQSRR